MKSSSEHGKREAFPNDACSGRTARAGSRVSHVFAPDFKSYVYCLHADRVGPVRGGRAEIEPRVPSVLAYSSFIHIDVNGCVTLDLRHLRLVLRPVHGISKSESCLPHFARLRYTAAQPATGTLHPNETYPDY